MTQQFSVSEWTPMRRAVWAAVREAHQKIADAALGGPEVVSAIHPDKPEPNYKLDFTAVPERQVTHTCDLWRVPISLCSGPEGQVKVWKIHDGKNDDTFYVSEYGEVFVRDE